jgi:hypothetical protein
MRSPWTVPLIMVATLTAGLGTRATRGQTPESPKKMAVVELFTSHG